MLTSRRARTVGVLCLVLVLGGLCLVYGGQTTVQAEATLPQADDLGYDAERYVGTAVEVSGIVIDTDPVVIGAEYNYYAAGERHGGFFTLTLRGLSVDLAERQIVEVYGVLESPEALTVQTLVVIPAGHSLYMYLVSFLAGLWVLGRLLAHWRLDSTRFAITKRTTPVRLWPSRHPTETEGDD